MTVFGIEVNKAQFTAKLLEDKLEKAVNVTIKIISQKAVNSMNI